MIFTKYDVSTSDEQVEKLTREYKIHYRYCIGSLIYLLYTILDLSFSVYKLAKFSANPGKVHFLRIDTFVEVHQGKEYFGPVIICRSE